VHILENKQDLLKIAEEDEAFGKKFPIIAEEKFPFFNFFGL
jgi:hypothetical protein